MSNKQNIKNITAMFLALLCALVSVSGCAVQEIRLNKTEISPIEEQKSLFLSEADIQIEPAAGVTINQIRELEGDRLIAIDYPSVDNNQKITDAVLKYINQRLDEFKSETDSMGAPTDETGLYRMRITYKPYIAENGAIGFKFTENIYSGMTNREDYITAMTFNGSTGDPIQIDELFNPSTNYLDNLAKTARAYLNREESVKAALNTDLFTSGTAPNIQNYSNFTIMPNHKIAFYFNKNTIAPAEAGAITVILPLSDFFDVLNPQFKTEIYGAATVLQNLPPAQSSAPNITTSPVPSQTNTPASTITVMPSAN